MKCDHFSKTKEDAIGRIYEYPCDRPVKFKVEYNEAVKGERKTSYVCGVHLNSIKKWSERVRKRYKWDSKMVIENIPFLSLTATTKSEKYENERL